MSIYPNAIDGFSQLPLVIDGVTAINAFSVNNLREAILNIESELGINPSGTYDTVVQRLDDLESSSGADLTALEARVAVLEASVSGLITELGVNPSGSFATVGARLDFLEASSTAPLTLVTDDAISVGNILYINASGNVQMADSNTGTTNESRTVGSSTASYLVGDTAEINSVPGKLIPARFAAAPAAISNGQPVYLSETLGLATITPPTTLGSVVFLLGILQGADGATIIPNILFQPNLIAIN